MPKRVDANQVAVVAALREYGATVLDMHTLGKGAPDIVVGYAGRNYLCEIKAPGGKLTPSERDWHNAWRGTVWVIYTVDQAIDLIREAMEDEE
jgi:hypothetical protein